MVAHKAEEEGFGPISMVTTDIQKAIEGVEVLNSGFFTRSVALVLTIHQFINSSKEKRNG